jgi:RNA polymerase sigma-70 factor (ECF subfamily)
MAAVALEPAVHAPAAHPARFEDFFRRHYGRVYGLLYRVTGSVQDAEDISQELFLDVSRRGPDMWGSPTTAAWLWKAATHTALNALRGERRRQAREERAARQAEPVRLLVEHEADPAGSIERRERQEAVRRALRQLNERDSLLLLARYSGLSYAEVADALQLNAASVGTLLARAEKRFKEVYVSQEAQEANR